METADSRLRFTTGNYGISTTSEIEWWFVHSPSAAALATLALERWPTETREAPHGRSPRPLAEFEAERRALSARLAAKTRGASLSADAVLAARLYTGPMFVKYNGVLRGIKSDAPAPFKERLASLCGSPPNVYATTVPSQGLEPSSLAARG